MSYIMEKNAFWACADSYGPDQPLQILTVCLGTSLYPFTFHCIQYVPPHPLHQVELGLGNIQCQLVSILLASVLT